MDFEMARYQEAMELHAQILASGNTAAQALVEFARLLKKMRDEKLHEVWSQTFEEYVEERVGIRQRQAYTYIKAYEDLGPRLMGEQAGLGITKLELLSHVSPFEREEVIENNDLNEMTVAEMKKLVEELNFKGEQLTFANEKIEELQKELEDANTWVEQKKEDADKASKAAAEVNRLEQELAAAKKQKAAEVKKAVDDAKKDNEKAVKDAVTAAKKKAADDMEKARKEAAEKAEQLTRAEYAEAEERAEQLRREIETLKKQSQIAGNQDAAVISAYCKTVLAETLNRLVEMISDAKERDAAQGRRLSLAAANMLGGAKAQLETLAQEDAEAWNWDETEATKNG